VSDIHHNVHVVILAAGEGKRMGGDVPKPLVELHGKPLIAHLLQSVKAADVTEKPVIVVGQKKETVIKTLGPEYDYVVQEEQLGTGHAVQAAEALLKGRGGSVLVLYADHPFVSPATIRALVATQERAGGVLTMATCTVPDFNEWRASFISFARITRSENGAVERIVEYKDASDAEKEIREVNPGYYVFSSAWLWEHLAKVENENAQGEYYLTDLIAMARNEGEALATVAIEPKEALGVNTREHLELLEKTFGT
jgi:bifunctional UDP-N-acetylglucosamine pyrophosphorylase/glucosamine-1-phosphate N-acetyltransferase